MDNIKIILSGELCLVPASKMEVNANEDYDLLAVRQPAQGIMPALTSRECFCLRRYAIDFQSIKEIAYEIGVTDRSVRFILEALRNKMDCKSTTEIVAKVYKNNWHQLPNW